MVNYVMIPKFCELTGYTDRAIRCKIHEGVWVEGIHYRRSSDRHIFINLTEFEKWVEGQNFASQALLQGKAA